MRKCDSCGKMYQESKDLFCPHCGAIATKKRANNHFDDPSSSRWIRNDVYGEQRASEDFNRKSERDAERADDERRFSGETKASGSYSNGTSGSYTGQTSSYTGNVNTNSNTNSNGTSSGANSRKATSPFNKTSKAVAAVICVIVAINVIAGIASEFEGEDFFNNYDYEYSDDRAAFDFGGLDFDAVIGDINISTELTDEDIEKGVITIYGEINEIYAVKDSFDKDFIKAIEHGEKQVSIEYGVIPFGSDYSGDVFSDAFYAKDIENTVTTTACSEFSDGEFKVALPYSEGSYYFPKSMKITYGEKSVTIKFPFECFDIVDGGISDFYNLYYYSDDSFTLDVETYDNSNIGFDGSYTDYYEF